MTTTRATDKEIEEEEKRLMEKYDRALTSNGVRKRRGLRLFFALSSPSEEEEIEEEEIEEEEEFFELDAKALFSSCYRDDRLHLVAFAHDDDDASSIRGEVETIGYGDGGNIFDSREKILRERNARLDEDVRRVRDLLERLKTNRMMELHRRRGDEREEENGGDVGSGSSGARGGKERTRFLLPSVERTTEATRGRETIIERWSIPAEELVARSVGLQPRDDDDDDDRDKNENESINAQLKAAVAATTSSITTKASPPLSAESLRLAGVLL